MRFVGFFFPFEYRPKDYGCKKGRIGVHFALHGREPKSIGKSVGQSTYQTGTQNSNHFCRLHIIVVLNDYFSGQMSNSPKQKQNSKGAKQCRHGIYHLSYLLGATGEIRKEATCQHKKRSSGRMSHIELVGRRNEFTAIPETGRRFNGEQIRYGCHQKSEPTEYVV